MPTYYLYIIITMKRFLEVLDDSEPESESKKTKLDGLTVYLIAKDGTRVSCNKDLIMKISKVFCAALESNKDDEINVPDYDTKIVKAVIELAMHLNMKFDSVVIVPSFCPPTESIQRIKFCHQYAILNVQSILVDSLCCPLVKSGNIFPSDFIRIGETCHIPKMVDHGVMMFDIKNKDEFDKVNSAAQYDSTRKQLTTRLYSSLNHYCWKI